MSTEITGKERSPRASTRRVPMKRLSIGVGLLVAAAGGPLRAGTPEDYDGTICGADALQNFWTGFAPGSVTLDPNDRSVVFAAPGSWMRCEINAAPAGAHPGDFSIEVELAGNPHVRDCRLVVLGSDVNPFFVSIPLAPLGQVGHQAGCDLFLGRLLSAPGARRFLQCMAGGGARIESVKVTYGTEFNVCPAI